MNKSTYEELLEMLKQNKEVELYKFAFTMSGKLDFYTKKVYKAEDGEKITNLGILASVFGIKYKLHQIKCVGSALIRGESFIVKGYLTDYGFESTTNLSFDYIKEYSLSIKEAMKEIASDETYLYFLGKDGYLYAFSNVEENKKTIELLLSKGLISRLEDFKENDK